MTISSEISAPKEVQSNTAKDAPEPLPATTLGGRSWAVTFDEPDLTSDAGIAALVSSGIGDSLLGRLADAINDPRRDAVHSTEELIRQRVFQIAGGYYDANDSDHLRDDIVMRAAAGKSVDQGLASQPTISRIEGSVSKKDLLRMAHALFDDYLDSFDGKAPKMICIDMDPSAHLVYGQQQLGLFNTHVGDHCMMPFYIFDGVNGRLMTAVQRPGTTPTAPEILAILKRIVKAIRERFPTTHITFRADSHHTKPAVMDFLDEHDVDFITGLSKNRVLSRLFASEIALAEERYNCRQKYADPTKQVVVYGSAYYAAGSWSGEQRVVARIIVGPLGVDVRYVVTSFEIAEAKYLYNTVYCGRGEAELFIKECKLGLGSDTSPCQKATANQFRLLLHAAAYVIMHRFRSTVLKGTKWERKTFAEIRLQLFKIAGRLKVLKTKVYLHLSMALEETHREIWHRSILLGIQ